MAIADVNATLRAFLISQAPLVAVVGSRIYCPRLPEGAILPALGFFVRGGSGNPHIPEIVEPSFQFDCWADDPIEARSVYRVLYEVLQGIQNQGSILSASEEVQGQDIQDVEYPNYHRVVTFFRVMMRV